MDLVVEDEVVVELKVVKELEKIHGPAADVSKAYRKEAWFTVEF